MSTIKINLLPDLVLQRRREAHLKKLATTGLTGWFILLGALTVAAFGFQLVQAQRLKAAQNQQRTLDAEVNSSENVAFRKEALAVQASLAALDNLFNNQLKMSTVSRSIASLTPKGVQLREITITQDKTVRMSGTATSYEEAGKFVAALKSSKPEPEGEDEDQAVPEVYFEGVNLEGANISGDGVAFSISVTYVYGGPSGGEGQ